MNRPTAALMTAVLLAGCGGGGPSKQLAEVTATGPADAQAATVGMNDKLDFTPTVVNAKVGTLTLTAKNLGAVPHNLVFDDESLGRTRTIRGHAAEDVMSVFTKPGTFTFTCTFHSGMDGRVVVS